MGFFSSNKGDQHDPSVQPDFVASVAPPDPQVPQPNIDGVIPPAGGITPAVPQPLANNASSSISAPPVDDTGTDYIMTDTPATTDETASPAYSPNVGAPSLPVREETPPNTETAPEMPEEQPAPEQHAEPEVAPEITQHVSIEPAYPPEMYGATAIPVSITQSPQDDPQSQDLNAIKQKALLQLSPLVSQLNQTPEERFNTTMMMLQATDNQTLVPVAYEAAQSITDEKTKAQALLDIVNEINYFTNSKRL